MKQLTNKYALFLIGGLISFGGLLFYDWKLSQMLFYIYLAQLLKFPTLFITYHKMNGSKAEKTFGFGFLTLIVFSFYSLFMLYLMNVSSGAYSHSGLFSAFNRHLASLTHYFALPLVGLLIVELISAYLKLKSTKVDASAASKLSARRFVYFGLLFFIPLICLVLRSNEFKLDEFVISIISLGVFQLSEFIALRNEPNLK